MESSPAVFPVLAAAHEGHDVDIIYVCMLHIIDYHIVCRIVIHYWYVHVDWTTRCYVGLESFFLSLSDCSCPFEK